MEKSMEPEELKGRVVWAQGRMYCVHGLEKIWGYVDTYALFLSDHVYMQTPWMGPLNKAPRLVQGVPVGFRIPAAREKVEYYRAMGIVNMRCSDQSCWCHELLGKAETDDAGPNAQTRVVVRLDDPERLVLGTDGAKLFNPGCVYRLELEPDGRLLPVLLAESLPEAQEMKALIEK